VTHNIAHYQYPFLTFQHCKSAKALLEELHTEESTWTYGISNLDHMDGEDGPTIQEHLLAMTGQKTVPCIFIGGKFIGGNSDLQAMHAANELLPKLEALRPKHDEM
jgi:glutaredoxin 3